MTNWANRNVGEVVLAGFGVLAAAAIAFAFNVGQNATTLQQVQNELRAQGNVLASLRQHIDDRFDQLESRFDITQTDLKAILTATAAVDSGDVFYAAMINGAVWVFPDETLSVKLRDRGLTPEPVNTFLVGYKVVPVFQPR